MHRRKLSFEGLSVREMLTANFGDQLPTPSLVQTFSVEANASHDSVVISNQSPDLAEFTMRFNGNFSVNVHDLVDQIREYEAPGDPDMPDYEKAYHYMLQFHTHDWSITEKFYMHEPSFYLNSLGVGLCDDVAGALKLIWNEMGYDSRIWYLNGHVVSEVYTGDRWEMYDADLGVVYYNRDGQVAGVEELAANPHYIYSPYVPMAHPDRNGVEHSERTASFYSTTDDNWICFSCVENLEERDLVFQIPSGGSLRMGEVSPERTIPNSNIDLQGLGLLTITIPPNRSGTLDIPLALYDVTGSSADLVTINSKSIRLGSNAMFEHINRDQGRLEDSGQRLQAISYLRNSQPIQVHYLVNKKFSQIHDENWIEIKHIGDATTLAMEASGDTRLETWTDVQTTDVNTDVNADGWDDFVGYGNGQWWVKTSEGTGFRNASSWGITPSPIAKGQILAADVDGDGRDEIVGRTDGGWIVARSTGSQFVSEFWPAPLSVDDELIGRGDFNGDCLDDIVGRTSDGMLWVSLSTGSSFEHSKWGSFSATTDWQLVIGDFNGDGNDDLLGHATTDGTLWLGGSTGTQFRNEYWGRLMRGIDWSNFVSGDWNGDGRSDTAARAPDGTWWASISDGNRLTNSFWGRWSTQVNWTGIRVADYNGDGRDDVAGRSDDGSFWINESRSAYFFVRPFFIREWGRSSTRVSWYDVSVGDYDGCQDLAARSHGQRWIGVNGG